MLALATSCKEKAGIIYSVSANGDCKGQFELTFPDGNFKSDGTAALAFDWSNDTTKVLAAPGLLSLDEALKSNNAKTLEAAQSIDSWLDNFSATTADGDYYVHLVGYVKETLTGITLSVDRTFTNRE